MKPETVERIHRILLEESERLNNRVLEGVKLYGKNVSDELLLDCKNANDALEDFEDWKSENID